jgi:hypothetical protein
MKAHALTPTLSQREREKYSSIAVRARLPLPLTQACQEFVRAPLGAMGASEAQ